MASVTSTTTSSTGTPAPRVLKSVTLDPGEVFSLPPGASVVGSTNEAALDSDCDLGPMEALQCYAFVMGNAEDDGDESQLFEINDEQSKPNIPTVGIRYDGKFYQFSQPVWGHVSSSTFDVEKIAQEVNKTSLGKLIFGETFGHNNPSGERGVMSYIVFKTIPSIAKKLALVQHTTAPHFGDNYVEFLIPAREHAEVDHFANMPACSTNA